MNMKLLEKHLDLQKKYLHTMTKLNSCIACLIRYLGINKDKRLIILLEEYGIFDEKGL